jgi:hypothetical protein
MTSSHFILLALVAFLGGIAAVMAFLTAFAWAMRSHGRMFSLHFGGLDNAKPYRDIEVISSTVRGGRVYVKYRNTGQTEISGLIFKIKVFDDAGSLVEETQEFVQDYTAPGVVNENLLGSDELLAALKPSGRTVSATIMYGQTE